MRGITFIIGGLALTGVFVAGVAGLYLLAVSKEARETVVRIFNSWRN